MPIPYNVVDADRIDIILADSDPYPFHVKLKYSFFQELLMYCSKY
jgi:hypothetical protein